MSDVETLGVLAHRGGFVVRRPELSVGVVQMVSRPSGLEVDLLARRPLDRRSATDRQRDIRAGIGVPAPAPRRLLPPFDEGLDLRVGWLDADRRAHWEYGSLSSSSGDHFGGEIGPSLRTVLDFPPLFDQVSIVLAWPEIGFPETVVSLPLPDRATVERQTMSVWRAPLDAGPVPDALHHRVSAAPPDSLAVEAGRVVAGPQVVSRGDQAVVVLTRLTAIGSAFAAQLVSVAKDDAAEAVMRRTPADSGPGASIAVIEGADAVRGRLLEGTSTGGNHAFQATTEFLLSRPPGDAADLLVAWPDAALPEVRVTIGFL